MPGSSTDAEALVKVASDFHKKHFVRIEQVKEELSYL
jgi:hypothetical protein